MKKHVILLLTLIVSACQNVPVWKYSMFERPAGNYNYPPAYIKGWQDGCESGADASANYFYKLKYKFKQDWQMLGNQVYMSGWEDAYENCRKYILQHNLMQGKGSIL